MDHVQVFPDGELNVLAAASRDTSPSFVRPISKAGQHRPRNITDVPKPHRCIPHLTHSRRLLPLLPPHLFRLMHGLIACLVPLVLACCCCSVLAGCPLDSVACLVEAVQ